jgi:hypothetical protein
MRFSDNETITIPAITVFITRSKRGAHVGTPIAELEAAERTRGSELEAHAARSAPKPPEIR